MKARLKDFSVSLDGTQLITLETSEDFRDVWDELHGQDVALEVKRYHKRRSLDANAYFWVLVGKLAEKLRQSPLEIYRHYIEQAGVFRAVDISEAAVQTLVHSWGLHGKGWICDVLDYGRHEDTRLVRLYYGSSVYNSKQMSALIDSIVEDCKEQGIETMTPDEIARMKARWADA